MSKIPGQKPRHNDITKGKLKEIMKDVNRAWSTDKCTADEIDKKRK